MSIYKLFQPVENPEIVIGLVAPVGTPLGGVESSISEILKTFNYESETVRVSNFLSAFNFDLKTETGTAFDRFMAKMSAGNRLRSNLCAEALACFVCAEIRKTRPSDTPNLFSNKAFIVRQLKHPAEVELLRRVYGTAFHLIGISCNEDLRRNNLTSNENLTAEEANLLIARDHHEENEKLGQQVVNTFYRSDCFVNIESLDNSKEIILEQLRRYFSLLFGAGISSPTISEYGLFLATSASYRSTDLSRQVGAAILNDEGDLLSLGANEVPKSGGGQYWGGEGDSRDFVMGSDANDQMRRKCVKEVISIIENIDESSISEEDLDAKCNLLKRSRLMNLTEFGRACHAEMEAILSCTRRAISTAGANLYSTTFPCHNCAKHIVGSGIKRVIYVEPYAKSLAEHLHSDSISFGRNSPDSPKVVFEPFSGIAPRRYVFLFSNSTDSGQPTARKDMRGKFSLDLPHLRLTGAPLTHVQREALATEFLYQLVNENVKRNQKIDQSTT